MFYIIIIISAVLIISLTNFLCGYPASLLEILLNTSLGTIAVIAVDGIFAFIIRRLTPISWFAPLGKIFTVSDKEAKFYRKIKIKAWKDMVPELGGFTSFSKSEISDPNDSQYLARFLTESNYGVIIHIANALLGFLIAFFPFCSSPSIWIPIFAVNFVLSLLPVFVLRFTSHTLAKLYKRSLKAAVA